MSLSSNLIPISSHAVKEVIWLVGDPPTSLPVPAEPRLPVTPVFSHSPFLSAALLQHPDDSSEPAYSQSVLPARNSASFIIRTTSRYLEKGSDLTLRHRDAWVNHSNPAVLIPCASPVRGVLAGRQPVSVSIHNLLPPRSRYTHQICLPTR